MRVVIEFAGERPWAGSLRSDAGGAVDAFDGRLDLLRLLEALVDPAARWDLAEAAPE